MTGRLTWLETVAAAILLILMSGSMAAPWLAQQDPFDPAGIDLRWAERPPLSAADSGQRFVMGTDGQGRDMWSLVLYGTGISIAVGVLSVLVSLALGVTAGLASGYSGGLVDATLMRLADAQLSFPAMLVALALDAVATAQLAAQQRETLMIPIVSLSIGLSQWAIVARTVRGSTMVECAKDYVQAARIVGAGPTRVLLRHVLPNVAGPILVLATVQLAAAVLIEATFSFLGVGLPPTSPSLGTLVRQGSDYLLAGFWWMVVFPGLALVLLTGSVTVLGDRAQRLSNAAPRRLS